MQFDEFVGQVQHRAQLASNGEAVRAIRATLETLGERLQGGAVDNLAAQLPREIGEYLRLGPKAGTGERYSVDDFFKTISERETADLPVAVYHARCVLEVLREAVSAGEIHKVRAQFPAEYQALFEAGSAGQLRKEKDGLTAGVR